MVCGFESHLQHQIYADVVELAYTQVSEACASRLEGSTPSVCTKFCKRSPIGRRRVT